VEQNGATLKLKRGCWSHDKKRKQSYKLQNPEQDTREIAIATETSTGHVSETLQKYGITTETLGLFKANRADIIAGLESKFLEAAGELGVIKDLVKRRGLVDYGILHDKEMELTGGKREVTPMVIINKISIGKVEDNVIDVMPGSC
jgi:hypothetical protein